MANRDLWLYFPSHLHPPALRSLSLAFILEELVHKLDNAQDLSLDFLDKISYYAGVLVEASNKKKESFLQKEISSMRITVLQFLHEKKAEYLTFFYEQLRSFFNSLIPFFFQARTDENILIYLMEHKASLNRHLGPLTIDKMIQSFASSNPDYLKTIISEGLTRRGFTSFLEEKEEMLDMKNLYPI